MTDDLLGGVVEDDSDLSHLPASERRAMQRLRDWLSCDDRGGEWLAVVNPNGCLPWPDVVCLLSGIDPEASLDADSVGWALLPGVLAFWGLADRPGREGLEAAVSSHICRVSKMIRVLEQKSGVPADLSPVEAIRAALAARLPVPWLDAALSDPVCRQFLPEELRLAEWRADVPRADPETRAPLPPEALEGHAPIIVEKRQRSGRKVDARRLVAGFILWRLYQYNPEIMPADAERETAAIMKESGYGPPAKRWIEDTLSRYRKEETPRDVFAHNARTEANSGGMTLNSAEATAARLLDLHRKKMSRE
ncbi:MAG: hypothetical protein KJZ85_14645 [Rhodobacteraceae bacterium]|nr:hypothetical protein [Paracoccaceae bacterium]